MARDNILIIEDNIFVGRDTAYAFRAKNTIICAGVEDSIASDGTLKGLDVDHKPLSVVLATVAFAYVDSNRGEEIVSVLKAADIYVVALPQTETDRQKFIASGVDELVSANWKFDLALLKFEYLSKAARMRRASRIKRKTADILFIDDNDIAQLGMKSLLERLGVKVIICCGLQELTASGGILRGLDVDLKPLLVDLSAIAIAYVGGTIGKNMGGWQVIPVLKAAGVFVVAMSREDQVTLMAAGADAQVKMGGFAEHYDSGEFHRWLKEARRRHAVRRQT